MSKYTKGPWAVYVNAPSDIVIRKMSKDGYELCSIASVSSGHANARLIATAPELLEALKVLVENGGIGPEQMFHDARAAIAKATGESA